MTNIIMVPTEICIRIHIWNSSQLSRPVSCTQPTRLNWALFKRTSLSRARKKKIYYDPPCLKFLSGLKPLPLNPKPTPWCKLHWIPAFCCQICWAGCVQTSPGKIPQKHQFKHSPWCMIKYEELGQSPATERWTAAQNIDRLVARLSLYLGLRATLSSAWGFK